MNISKAAKIWFDFYKTHLNKTAQSYRAISEGPGLMPVDGHPTEIAHKRQDQYVPWG